MSFCMLRCNSSFGLSKEFKFVYSLHLVLAMVGDTIWVLCCTDRGLPALRVLPLLNWYFYGLFWAGQWLQIYVWGQICLSCVPDHLFRKLIFLEGLCPPFPPSQGKGFLPLCDLLNVTLLTVSGPVLEGKKTTIILGDVKVASAHSLFCTEEVAPPSLPQLWKKRQKYSDVSNGAACSACAATAWAHCKSVSHRCKLFSHSAKCK